MAESVQTTWEEACRCPKCQVPGKDNRIVATLRGVRNVPNGAKVHEVKCVNERCEWYDTPWMVQQNPDGSVPPKTDHSGHEKHYVGFEGHDQMARDIHAALEREKNLSTRPGAHNEVRSPFRRRDI
jgi:hypothetical protein